MVQVGDPDATPELALVGKESNRLGVGVRVRADIVEASGPRSIHLTVGSGGSFGASTLRGAVAFRRGKQLALLA